MQTINKEQAKELIKDSKGLIFSTSFIKKDNTTRTLTSRLFIKYKKTGIEPPYKPADYNLLPLYDMKKKAFRMLNLNTLLTLSINKTKYIINE